MFGVTLTSTQFNIAMEHLTGDVTSPCFRGKQFGKDGKLPKFSIALRNDRKGKGN